MSESVASVRRKIDGATDLQGVVRAMKALAASSIGQYEQSVPALAEYFSMVELGLGACLRRLGNESASLESYVKSTGNSIGAVVFGSDQGLVGQFNESIAEYAIDSLAALPDEAVVWAVGERVRWHLANAGLRVAGAYSVPGSAHGIANLVGEIQVGIESFCADAGNARVFLFHNCPRPGALYEPVGQPLLPLDEEWRRRLVGRPWPTRNLPEALCAVGETLRALIREYLFVSIFRACAESLASENASRLSAMQRAEKNIDELLGSLRTKFHRLRQSGIDEELFAVVSGFEALVGRY